MTFAAHDERRHDGADVEAWWFFGTTEDRSLGWFVGLELTGHRFDYWAGLVRRGEPYLYIEELDCTGLRAGLEIKPPEMWAGLTCDDPFRQWSLGNEAHGVLLDDPTEVWNRAYGEKAPVTFDVEWYATDDPSAVDGGYEQVGEFDAEIELSEGVVAVTGSAHRLHVWGRPWLPPASASPDAPFRRRDGSPCGLVLGVHNGGDGVRP